MARDIVVYDQPAGGRTLQVAFLFDTPDETRKIAPPTPVSTLRPALQVALDGDEQERLNDGSLSCVLDQIELVAGDTEETVAEELRARFRRAQFVFAVSYKTRSRFLGLRFDGAAALQAK